MDFHQSFPSFDAQTDDPVRRLEYQQIASSAKLEKLSHRITLVSVMIPVLILALTGFVYLDMRERVISSDTSKQNQMEAVSTQMTEKLNSLDTRLTKIRQNLDQQLPKLIASDNDLSQKMIKTMEGSQKISTRVSTLEKNRAPIDASMTAMQKSLEKIGKHLDRMEVSIKKNTEKNIAAFATIERINKSLLLSMDNAILEVQKDLQALNQQIQAIKKEKEQSIIIAKQYKTQLTDLETRAARSMEDLRGHIKRVEISVAAIAGHLSNQNEKPTSPKSSSSKPSSASKPPATYKGQASMDSSFTGISAQPLTE